MRADSEREHEEAHHHGYQGVSDKASTRAQNSALKTDR